VTLFSEILPNKQSRQRIESGVCHVRGGRVQPLNSLGGSAGRATRVLPYAGFRVDYGLTPASAPRANLDGAAMTRATSRSAMVSAGWRRDKIVHYCGRESAFRAQLSSATDGSEKRFGTDAAWPARSPAP
jgi:hypothetical protein